MRNEDQHCLNKNRDKEAEITLRVPSNEKKTEMRLGATRPVANARICVGAGRPAISVGLLTVRFRNAQHIIPALLILGLYASPVAWSVSAVPTHHRLVYLLNPRMGLLEAYR
jgi:ABC-type polysaccharide/polyol phosphate export permease